MTDTTMTSVFGSDHLTGALLDRLTHQAYILEMNEQAGSRRNNATRPKRI
jgi:hypothetical protein